MNKNLKSEYLLEFDSGDKWGSNISYMFKLCEYLHFFKYVDSPQSLEFSPGIGTDLEAGQVEFFNTFSIGDINHFLLVLNRYDSFLRFNNENY